MKTVRTIQIDTIYKDRIKVQVFGAIGRISGTTFQSWNNVLGFIARAEAEGYDVKVFVRSVAYNPVKGGAK